MNVLRYLIICGAALLSLAACDDYADPASRFEPVPDSLVTPQRSVLMVEFTGQNCVNCPAAHERIEEYQQMFGSNFICVSIHGGDAQLGMLDPGAPEALGTAMGVEYNNLFGIRSWPSAVVDWNSGNLEGNFGKWLTAVVSDMIHPTELSLSAEARYYASESLYAVDVRVRSDVAISGSPKLMVWFCEDSIVAPQLTTRGYDWSYVHNNVFRTAFPEWSGVEMDIPANLERFKGMKTPGEKSWNPENMNAVVFVYTESQGVLAVVKEPFVIDNENLIN